MAFFLPDHSGKVADRWKGSIIIIDSHQVEYFPRWGFGRGIIILCVYNTHCGTRHITHDDTGNEKGSSSTHIYNIPGVRKNKEGVMEITPGLTCFCIAYA
jgi:hypothetical protein